MKGTATRHRPWLLLPGLLVIASVASGSEAPKPATSCERTASLQPAAPVATTPQCESQAATPVSAEAGLRVFLEPETGKIGHGSVLPDITPMEESVLKEAETQPVVTMFPDGSAMVELNGTCQDFSVIQLDANGKKIVGCTQDPNHVHKPVAAPQPTDR